MKYMGTLIKTLLICLLSFTMQAQFSALPGVVVSNAAPTPGVPIWISFGGNVTNPDVNNVTGAANTTASGASNIFDTAGTTLATDIYISQATTDGGIFNTTGGTYPSTDSWDRAWQGNSGDTLIFVVDSLVAGEYQILLAHGGNAGVGSVGWYEVTGTATNSYTTSYNPQNNTTAWDTSTATTNGDSLIFRVSANGSWNMPWITLTATGN